MKKGKKDTFRILEVEVKKSELMSATNIHTKIPMQRRKSDKTYENENKISKQVTLNHKIEKISMKVIPLKKTKNKQKFLMSSKKVEETL